MARLGKRRANAWWAAWRRGRAEGSKSPAEAEAGAGAPVANSGGVGSFLRSNFPLANRGSSVSSMYAPGTI